MGVFISNAITDRGRILLGEAQVGATFEATRIVMGSGFIPAGYTARTMTAVVAPVIELAINKKKRAGDGTVTFGGVYSNENITEAFYFREFALYARVEYADGTYSDEVLYSYGNAGDNADLMPAYSTSTVVEKQMDLVTWVGNDTAVNLTVESGLYTPHAEKHAADGEDPITPAMIGAFPGTKLMPGGTDANELTTEGIYFLMNGINIPKFHGFVEVRYFDGDGFAPDLSWGRTHCIRQIFRDYNSVLICERYGLLKAEISNEWVWSDWAEVYNSSTAIRVPDKTKAGSCGKLDSENGVSLVHLKDRNNDNSDRNALIVNPYSEDISGAILFARGGDGLASVKYKLYGEHYSPAVTATAELI